MSAISLIDWILTTALVVASWQLYQLIQPRPPAPHKADPGLRELAQPPPELTRPIGEAGSLDDRLQRIQRAGGYRDLAAFMNGARLAYEAVVKAFAAGDLAPVAAMLAPDVRRSLEEAVAARRTRGETLTTTFIGFAGAEPVDAGIDNGSAWIDVHFVSQMVSVTTDREGRVVAGHPARIDETAEVWTFARETRAADPNWMLVATAPDE